MNKKISFNTEVNKHLKDKFKSEKWSGVSPKFYKNDIPNLIKCIEINKLHNQNGFFCTFSVYSNFNNSNAPKGKMHTHKQIFLVGINPNEMTNTSYHWPLKDDEVFNANQINLLWEAIASHGKIFFNGFNNFPEPFLDIKPNDFIKGKVKLFNTYEVYSQINYMNFLKEIYLSLNDIEMATKFSNLAVERYYYNTRGKKILDTKPYKKLVKEYLQFLKMPKP